MTQLLDFVNAKVNWKNLGHTKGLDDFERSRNGNGVKYGSTKCKFTHWQTNCKALFYKLEDYQLRVTRGRGKKKKALGNTGPYWRCTLAATDTEQKGYEVKLRNVGNVEHKIECCWTQRWCR